MFYIYKKASFKALSFQRCTLLCVCVCVCTRAVCSVMSDSAISWAVACQASPGKNAGVGCHFLLQEIFLTQGWKLHLLQWQVDSLPLSHGETAR